MGMAFCPDDFKGLFEDFKVQVRIKVRELVGMVRV